MTTKNKKPQPRRPATTSSRTLSRNPSFLLSLAVILLALSAAWFLSAADTNPSATSPNLQQHMQRLLHRAAAPLTNGPSSLVARIFPHHNNFAFSQTATMASSTPTNNDKAPDAQTANTVDADSFHPGDNRNPLALPSPEDAAEAIKLDLSSGEGVKLDALGPMVVNTDGSLSRIANWDRMAEIEKRNTLRIIGKRNRARLEALGRKQEEESAPQ